MTDVETKVDLDTRSAHASLRGLDRRKEKAAKRAQSQVWSNVRNKASMAVGAVVGFKGIGAIVRQHAGNVDPWVAAFIPIQASVQQFVDEEIGHSAIATRRAIETTKQMLSTQVGRTSNLTHVNSLYSATNLITQQEEQGRNIVQQALQGPSYGELLEQSVSGFVALLGKSFGYITDSLR